MKFYLRINPFYLSLHSDFPRSQMDSYMWEIHYFQYRYLHLRIRNQHKDLKDKNTMITYKKLWQENLEIEMKKLKSLYHLFVHNGNHDILLGIGILEVHYVQHIVLRSGIGSQNKDLKIP